MRSFLMVLVVFLAPHAGAENTSTASTNEAIQYYSSSYICSVLERQPEKFAFVSEARKRKLECGARIPKAIMLMVSHLDEYKFDPYDCAFKGNLALQNDGDIASSPLFYYDPEKNKYISENIGAYGEQFYQQSIYIDFEALEGSYCRPAIRNSDIVFYLNQKGMIQLPNIRLIATEPIAQSNDAPARQPGNLQQETANLFDLFASEPEQETENNTVPQNDESGELVMALKQELTSALMLMEAAESNSIALRLQLEETKVALERSTIKNLSLQIQSSAVAAQVSELSQQLQTLWELLAKKEESHKALLQDQIRLENEANLYGLREKALEKQVQVLTKDLNSARSKAASEHALRLKLEQKLKD
jgi:hypothetical protein